MTRREKSPPGFSFRQEGNEGPRRDIQDGPPPARRFPPRRRTPFEDGGFPYPWGREQERPAWESNPATRSQGGVQQVCSPWGTQFPVPAVSEERGRRAGGVILRTPRRRPRSSAGMATPFGGGSSFSRNRAGASLHQTGKPENPFRGSVSPRGTALQGSRYRPTL